MRGPENLGGVEAAIDPDDGLALDREAKRLFTAHAVGLREATGDFLVALEVGVVLRRGDDRLDVGPPLLGIADRVQNHPVGFVGQHDEVLVERFVVEKHIVGADFVPEVFGRRRDPVLCLEWHRDEEGDDGRRGKSHKGFLHGGQHLRI